VNYVFNPKIQYNEFEDKMRWQKQKQKHRVKRNMTSLTHQHLHLNTSCLIFRESRFQSIPTIIVSNLFQHLTFYYYFLTQIFGRQLAEIKIGVSWCVVKSKSLSILLFALIVSLKRISKKKKKNTKEFEHFYQLYIFLL